MSSQADSSEPMGPGLQQNRNTTVPLAVQPQNVIDTTEVSTPYSKKKQIIATICATFGCLLNGTVIGYSAPAIPSFIDPKGADLYGNSFQLTFQQASWITGILSLGCFFGCIFSGYVMEKLGRKATLMYVTSTCFFLGYLAIFLAHDAAVIYFGRFLGGMGVGFELAVATVYIVEIASTDMRGILGCFVQFMGSIGVLFTFVVGIYLNWYYLALVNGSLAIVFVILLTFIPESPRWLILRGKEFSASRSIEWLRGRNDAAVDREVEKIKRDIAARSKERVSLTQLRDYWRPFLVSLTMMLLLQLSGLLVLVYYAVSIFEMSRTSVDPNIASIIVALTLLISSFVAIIIVSRLSRKLILVVSMLGMSVCLITLAICFHISEHAGATNETERPEFLGWLPVVAIILYLFLGNAGYGSLIWVVTAEILPAKVRSIANSIIICFAFLCGFIVSKTFVDLLQTINSSGTFFLYAGICLTGTVFTFFFVPETRGKSFDEIQKFFDKTRGTEEKDRAQQEILLNRVNA